MKVIFLDIDGVLNEAGSDSRTPLKFLGIDQPKVARLKKIIDATDAKVVLVSTWKEDWDPHAKEHPIDTAYMLNALAAEGVSLFDRTYDNMSDRGHGIVNWLAQHPDVDQFVILDDDVFADYRTLLLTPHQVKTHFGGGGLLDKHVSRAVYILTHGVENGSI